MPKPENVKVLTFGSPRVFGKKAAQVYDDVLGKNTLRVAMKYDPITILGTSIGWQHVGKRFDLKSGKIVDLHRARGYKNLAAKLQGEIKTTTSKRYMLGRVIDAVRNKFISFNNYWKKENQNSYTPVKIAKDDIKTREYVIGQAAVLTPPVTPLNKSVLAQKNVIGR